MIIVLICIFIILICFIGLINKKQCRERFTNPKIAVYCCNFGNYRNELNKDIDQGYFDKDIDYYFYTNQKKLTSNKWKIIYFPELKSDDVMDGNRWANKHVKFILPDELKTYDIVVYKDSKTLPIGVKYNTIVKLYNKHKGKKVFFQKHCGRANLGWNHPLIIQEELKSTLRKKEENEQAGQAFLRHVKDFTSPIELMDLCNFIRTTDKETNQAFEHAFHLLKKHKLKRDQNVFIYALDDIKYPPKFIKNIKCKYGILGN